MSPMSTLHNLQLGNHYPRTDSCSLLSSPVFFHESVAYWSWSSIIPTPSFLNSGSPLPGRVQPEWIKVYPPDIVPKPFGLVQLNTGNGHIKFFTSLTKSLISYQLCEDHYIVKDKIWYLVWPYWSFNCPQHSPLECEYFKWQMRWTQGKDCTLKLN